MQERMLLQLKWKSGQYVLKIHLELQKIFKETHDLGIGNECTFQESGICIYIGTNKRLFLHTRYK